MTTYLKSKGKAIKAPCNGGSGSGSGTGGGMSHGGMKMACGDMTCPSSKATMKENMAMHSDMTLKFTCDPGIDFVRGMIPHHDGAVKMCKILRDAAKPMGMGHGKPPYKLDAFLDKLCKDIEKTQADEIKAMTKYLQSKRQPITAKCATTTPGTTKMMGMVMGCGQTSCPSSKAFMKENMAMHMDMAVKLTCDPGIDFVRGMIPHHVGAVKMCKVLTDSTKPMGMGHGKPPYKLDSFLSKLCKDIVSFQNSEIQQMTTYLKSKGKAIKAPCNGGSGSGSGTGGGMSHGGMKMACGDMTCPSSKATMKENMAMHSDMTLKFTCDPGIDFVRGMIPHHDGAVKMCKILRDAAKPMGMGHGK